MITHFIRALVVSVALVCVAPVSVSAQDDPEYSSDELSDDGFRAAEGSSADSVPGGPLMIAAYMALWLLVGGYVLRLARRHREVQSEYAAIRKAVEDIDDRLSEMRSAE
jgi:CcmD family protein